MAVRKFLGWNNVRAKHLFNPLKTDKVKVPLCHLFPDIRNGNPLDRSQPSPVCPYEKKKAVGKSRISGMI
jgi:hypothetical protein